VEAVALRRGVCQDLSHIFIACARLIGAPARYVSGHLVKLNGEVEQQASHAWAEALVPGLGWVGFDAANGACPAETHVRVATGFDYMSAAPVRGTRIGGGAEELSVKLAVADMAQRQMQASA
jgi:transglutaminase-like putative cysteine protease